MRSMTAAPKWRTGATMTKRHELALPSRNTDRQDSVDETPQAQHHLTAIRVLLDP